jgi:hypothetical protein
MREGFFAILLALTPLGCAPETQQAVDLADQVNTVAQCARFEAARQRVDAVMERLTEHQIRKAMALNRLAAIHCATSLPELTDELDEIADAGP